LCRLYFNGTKKYLITFDQAKKEVRTEIKNLDEIYGYSNLLLAALNNYTNQSVAEIILNE